MQAPPSDRMGAFFARISKAACSGAPLAPCRLTMTAAHILRRKAPKFVIAGRPKGDVFAGAFLLSTPVLRDCRVASLLAMTIRGPVPFYRQPVPTVSSAPGGACPSPTTRDWKLRVTLHYPLSIFHLHHAAPTTTALIRIGGGGHVLYICLTGARTSCSCGAGGGPAPP